MRICILLLSDPVNGASAMMANPMRRIRAEIFGLSQTDFAAAIGRDQSTISRWEATDPDKRMVPNRDDMAAIRQLARARGIRWKDAWFFEEAPPPMATGDAA